VIRQEIKQRALKGLAPQQQRTNLYYTMSLSRTDASKFPFISAAQQD
jgi:hypothetical protein